MLDTTIAWYEAHKAANPLSVLQGADPTFESESLATYVQRRDVDVLFPAQITAIEAGLTRDGDLTVSLPTSSGKTLLAEFKIAATLERHPDATVIYVAPYRLLARQVTRAFERYLGPRLRHTVQDLGAGYDVDSPEKYGNVLVCTPERLDALIRTAASDPKSSETLERCKLLVFDEMHLIGRTGRGPRFELLLTRLRLRFPSMQILALSAASQGVDDVADWLTRGHVVRSGRRPTGTIEVAWETDGAFVQRVDKHTPTAVAELARTAKPIEDAILLVSRLSSEYRPVLAVCTQRAYAEKIATSLVENDPTGNRIWLDALPPGAIEQLNDAVEVVSSMMGPHHPLTHCLRNGIAFHHAGVPSMVLGLIEDLAASRILRSVAATTTVAEGADLPFRAVVIPHLNFQGGTGKLERDLYLNIIGRAGRANIAMEGVVFILGSKAATLQSHIRGTLWTTAQTGKVRGQLSTITANPQSAEETTWYGEFESQVVGWLGDGDSYYPDQASRLAAATFTFQTGNSSHRQHVQDLTQDVLESLERDGFALAASPFRLTDRGKRARLTGMSTGSVTRIEEAIAAGVDGWLPALVDSVDLTLDQCSQVARTVYESTETMAQTLWLRREHKTEIAKSAYLSSFAQNAAEEHVESEIFWAEVNALAMWMRGLDFASIAETMPTFGRQGLFGSNNQSDRVSDVAEYVSKVGYPGSWTWSAAHTLANEIYELSLPTWIAGAVEYGASDETAVTLMRVGGISRPGALALSAELGPAWTLASEVLKEDDIYDATLSEVDQDRLEQLRFLIRERD
ncbi:DEAD/DEAH box helicase [Nocardioides sp. NPDC087217]|uniref:DEAD/DEAH box helicase n=1 Tax=Nocardioides sp. NPDC087217 TaxID=3364335 RepID=UPI003816AE96